MASLGLVACDDDDGDSDSGSSSSSSGGDASSTGDGSTTEPYWAVGEQGEMLRIEPDGAAGGYDLDEQADLLAIDCFGRSVAWAVGSSGTLIRTSDGGSSWERVELETGMTLRGVSIVDDANVYVAGDAGGFYVTHDGGGTWEVLAAPAVDFTAVATDEAGSVALLTAMNGTIWRYHQGDSVEAVHEMPGAVLHAISVTADGQEAVAVGDLGLWLLSIDGGSSWSANDVGTARDLHAVQLAHEGGIAVAVGEAGVVVRSGPMGLDVTETLDPALSLQAVHLSASGHGIAVGDAGVVLLTTDLGDQWMPGDLATSHDLLGVDGLGGHAHL